MFKGKILVGHSIKNDLTALLLSHPKTQIRDTSRYRPLMRVSCHPFPVLHPRAHHLVQKHGAKYRARGLKDLTKEHLHKVIQSGEHDSVEDARCTLEVYKLHMEEWENSLREAKKAYMLPKKGKEAQEGDVSVSKKRKHEHGDGQTKKRRHE